MSSLSLFWLSVTLEDIEYLPRVEFPDIIPEKSGNPKTIDMFYNVFHAPTKAASHE